MRCQTLSLVALASFMFLTACGGSGGNPGAVVPPGSGGSTNGSAGTTSNAGTTSSAGAAGSAGSAGKRSELWRDQRGLRRRGRKRRGRNLGR